MSDFVHLYKLRYLHAKQTMQQDKKNNFHYSIFFHMHSNVFFKSSTNYLNTQFSAQIKRHALRDVPSLNLPDHNLKIDYGYISTQ